MKYILLLILSLFVMSSVAQTEYCDSLQLEFEQFISELHAKLENDSVIVSIDQLEKNLSSSRVIWILYFNGYHTSLKTSSESQGELCPCTVDVKMLRDLIRVNSSSFEFEYHQLTPTIAMSFYAKPVSNVSETFTFFLTQ